MKIAAICGSFHKKEIQKTVNLYESILKISGLNSICKM